jgi:hypothetical protein
VNVAQPKKQQTLPLQIDLDFSDEKSQNLFIFQQKYAMKKQDCARMSKHITEVDN